MKKIFTTLSAIFFVVSFSGCSFLNNRDDEEKIKQLEDKISTLENQISENEGANEDLATKDVENPTEEAKDKENIDKEKQEPPVEEKKIEVYEGPNFIKINSPANNAGMSKQPVVFTGEVSPNTSKIIVVASSDGPDGPVKYNTYQLQSFKEGDKNFKYSARIDWGNLKSGQNYYEFTAYLNDGTTKSEKITINYYVGENSFTMNQPIDGISFSTQPITFSGTVSPNVNKITVRSFRSAGEYKGYEYDGYDDLYTLQNFKSGDTSVVYRASKEFGNLYDGPNNYEFTAHFDDGTTKSVSISNIWFSQS